MPKTKRVVRTKEELLKQLKNNIDFTQRMKFVKEQFYPALCKASKNIEDATTFLTSINNIIMNDFLGRMKDVKLSEMKLTEKLDPQDEKYDDLVELIKIFDDLDVFKAKEYLEGMRQEINLFLSEENKERKLESLKTKWLTD